jgi:phosphoenolpyruvate carboxykinase (diphosphate)
MDTSRTLGLDPRGWNLSGNRDQLTGYIRLKLAALGVAVPLRAGDRDLLEMAGDLLANHREQSRLLSGHLCPADARIQAFLDDYLAGERLIAPVALPTRTLVLDRHGLARELSLPSDTDVLESPILSSYRINQGVLHNPQNDRRTTQGVFHISEGGLPVPDDKLAVPRVVFGNLLVHALRPPPAFLRLPFTSGWAQPAELFTSLLLRPVVCPEVPGLMAEKTMEIRFLAPGALVANLDFVESVFGNAGDPELPEHDAGLDSEHWTGHSGMVILAPHLIQLTKQELGLPRFQDASARQRRDGMCWKEANERYNGGNAFKVTARTAAGVMVTVLADNYFGYCKKEVKTQISFSANRFGLAEEEHAGGAIAYASYVLGDEFHGDNAVVQARGHTFAEVRERCGDLFTLQSEGYAIDRRYADVFYVPEDVRIDLRSKTVCWLHQGLERTLTLRPGITYVHPAGYKVHLEKHPGAPTWRLVGTVAEGTFCHKPCTVSGGGKSEISKSLTDAVIYGPIFINDVEQDLAAVERIFTRDYSDRMLPHLAHDYSSRSSRSLLSPGRSLGSVIKLLTPSKGEFTDTYNQWLSTIPSHIRALVFIIKRFHKQSWGEDWRRHFSVDIVNGAPGHELKYGERKLVGSYLRVGLSGDGSWRTFKLRQDFIAALKVQQEDDISASIVVPSASLSGLNADYHQPSVKLAVNCEYRLFQRPDEAIHRGYDKQAEADMAAPGLFCTNYQPLAAAQARALVEDAMEFELFTAPMRSRLAAAAALPTGYVASSAHPRLVGGKPSKNPRYLQVRPDLVNHRDRYLGEIGTRLYRRLASGQPLHQPVNAVLPGRRNNPPDGAIRMLAVYNPIHYQELPELFMDFVCSLTGKSPSTTGAGSEGALTKGPFNAVRATADLNNALVSWILTGHDGFTSAAGHIGPGVQVDHDISLLMPEIWCRLPVAERDPVRLIREGHLEPLADYTYRGRQVLASRLGYRITAKFVHTFFGKIFDAPAAVFNEAILRPESQDAEAFADGVESIIEAQCRVAKAYFEDGSIDEACPPLAAALALMAHGSWQGKGAADPGFRALFTRQSLLASDWYRQRLQVKQRRDIALWQRHVAYLATFLARPSHADEAARLGLVERLASATRQLGVVSAPAYIQSLSGTIGADPMGEMVAPAAFKAAAVS